MLLDFLSNNILGIIEDNWPSFAIGYLFKQNPELYFEQLGYPHGYYLIPSFNEPFSQIPFLLSALYINEILAFNLFIIVTFLLNIFFGYKFFKLFNKTQIIAVILSVIFAFSPYFRYQSRSHPDLIQFWPLFILFGLAINATLCRKNSFKIGTVLYLASCFTNYLGFFGFLITNLIIIIRSIQQKLAVGSLFKLLFIQNFVYLTLFSITIYITYVKLPQLIKTDNYEKIATSSIANPDISRNIEDFFYFSLRPWYFITPPPENPLTGQYAKSFIELLQTRWGHWLTFDYFPSEHSAAFLGFANIILAVLGIKFLLNKNHARSIQNKSLLILIGVTTTFIVLMTLPPYIPITGVKIYTPNYLLFLTANIFRTTARFGTINLMLVLILTGYGYQYIANRIKNKYVLIIVFLSLFTIQFVEFWSPLRILNVSQAPQIHKTLAMLGEKNIAVFPYSRTIDTAFWIRIHGKNIINTHALKYNQFDSKKFTGNLAKCDSIGELLETNAELLVYFNISDKNKHMEFFDNIIFLQKIDSVQINPNQKTYKNFFVNYYDMDNPDNSVVIYKVIKQNGVVDNYCNNNE